MLRRPALVLLASALGLTALAGTTTPPATADGKVDLDLVGVRDVVVDDTHGRVFISQGSDQVVVTDLDGTRTAVVEGLFGAAGMALSADDATLYVGMSSGDAIGIVDTATLEVDTVATGVQTCPENVALTAGLVWFSQSCGTEGIGALDPADRSVDLGVSALPDAQLATSPGRPDELFVVSQTTTYAFDATGGDAPALVQRLVRVHESAWYTADFAVTPDGSKLITTACQGGAIALRTQDFSNAGNYVGPEYTPSAVAIRDDGYVALGAQGYNAPDLFVMPTGSTTPMRRYEAGYNASIVTRSLAFGATRLYALSTGGGRGYTLHVVTPRRVSEIAIHADRTSYDHGETAEVGVELEGGDTSREVSVWATPVGEEPVLVSTGTVPVGGTYTARFPVTRTTSFSATYAGDAAYDPDEDKTKPVKVGADLRGRLLDPERMSGKYHLYPASRRAVLQATLAPNLEGRCVTVRVQYLVRGQWGYDGKTDCLRPDRRGRVHGYTQGSRQLVGMPLRMRAEFRGDKVNAETTSPWLYLKFTR